ncbi:MAG: glycosyltransferase family 2 protein, partial [Planctomycetota bacterium]
MNDVPHAIATTTIAGAAFAWTVLTAPSLLYLWRTRLPESLHRRGSKKTSTSRAATVSGIPVGTRPDEGASDCRERAVDSPTGTGPPRHPALPKVSVIVAARDEAARVADCLRSILASDYPDFELIAVDDRSTDGTGQRMDEVAAADPRCRVVHITELPEGWLGKCWALHCGTRAARGEWLLFCDGDVLLAPDCVRAAIAEATRCGLDHLALMPGMAG